MNIMWVKDQKKHNADMFSMALGYDLRYDRPQTFNEKLNWLKFNYRDPLMTMCSGKDTVREYVSNTLGVKVNRYLTKLVGKGPYSSVNDIDFDTLPKSFALKLNNGSGTNIICSDKTNLNIKQTKEQLEEWLMPEYNHYYNFYEWGYKNVKPKIVCEEYLGDWGSIRDYKVFCFNGEPRFFYVSDEFDSSKKIIDMDYLTLDWQPTGYVRKSYKPPEKPFNRPVSLDEMIVIAKKLAKPFPFVRVDFFEIDSTPKVAELTFYPAAGYGAFEKVEHDLEIGKMLRLPKPMNSARLLEIGYFK